MNDTAAKLIKLPAFPSYGDRLYLACSGIESEDTFVARWVTRDKATPIPAEKVSAVTSYWHREMRVLFTTETA